jgi:hypothetical protein
MIAAVGYALQVSGKKTRKMEDTDQICEREGMAGETRAL